MLKITKASQMLASQTTSFGRLQFYLLTIDNLFQSKTMRKHLRWSQKEDQLIVQGFSTLKSKKWKIISQILRKNGFFKKQIECRERYMNHLDSNLDKDGQISLEELTMLYKKYEQLGPKWTSIQHFVPKRSQAQLKNVFYGNLRCFAKKTIKFFTGKTAAFVKKFDAYTLQNMYSGRKFFRGIDFLKDDIREMNFSFDEDKCLQIIQARKQSFCLFFKALISQKNKIEQNHRDNSERQRPKQRKITEGQQKKGNLTHFNLQIKQNVEGIDQQGVESFKEIKPAKQTEKHGQNQELGTFPANQLNQSYIKEEKQNKSTFPGAVPPYHFNFSPMDINYNIIYKYYPVDSNYFQRYHSFYFAPPS